MARRCGHLSSVQTSSVCVCGVSEHGVRGWGSLGVLVIVREPALLGAILISGVFLEVLC